MLRCFRAVSYLPLALVAVACSEGTGTSTAGDGIRQKTASEPEAPEAGKRSSDANTDDTVDSDAAANDDESDSVGSGANDAEASNPNPQSTPAPAGTEVTTETPPSIPPVPDTPGVDSTEQVLACDAFDPSRVLASMAEANCDARTPSSCPAGTHIDFASDPCAVCVEDTKENRTCDWAESCFAPFVLTVAKTSGASLCETDDDCVAHHIDAACGESVKVALNGYIDEEVTWIAQLFATQNCASCDVSDEVTFSTPSEEPFCNRGQCELRAEETPDNDAGAVSEQNCWFEFLGDWVRCEESFSSGETAVADRISTCAEQCLADPDCTTVYDHTYLDVGLDCRLHEGACSPSTGIGYEEDGAREYRKVCGDDPPEDAIFSFDDEPGVKTTPNAECRFEYLGEGVECEDFVGSNAEVTGEAFSECLAACEADASCTAVVDWWLDEPMGFQCVLHTASCDAPAGSNFGLRTFKKVCD